MTFDDLASFADIETAMILLLEEEFPELEPGEFRHVDTVIPQEMKTFLPFVRIGSLGGSDDRVTDRPTVDVDVFHSSRNSAYDLSEGIRARLLGFPHRVGNVVIDRVVTVARPTAADWPDDTIRRFLGTYQTSLRRPRGR